MLSPVFLDWGICIRYQKSNYNVSNFLMYAKNNYTFLLTRNIKNKVLTELSILNQGTRTDINKQADRYYYIIHHLLTYQLHIHNFDKKEGTPISTETLFKLFKDYKIGSDILTHLQSWGIIKMVKQYNEGVARRYIIADNYSTDSIIYQTPIKSPFVDRLVKRKQAAETIYTKHQLSMLKKTSLSIEGINYVTTKYPELKNQLDNYNPKKTIIVPEGYDIEPSDLCLISFLKKDFWVTRPDNNNRLFSNFTCLKSEYRAYLLLDGHPLYSSDINNSQVLFSVPIVEKKLREMNIKTIFTLPEDFRKYKSLSEKGKIYEELYAEIADEVGQDELTGDVREVFKRQGFFAGIFYCKAGRGNRVADIFNEKFPNIFKVIEQIKIDEKYNQFAIKCQQSESRIMIDKVLKRLISKRIKVLILHDAIYANSEKDIQIVNQLIEEELYKELKLKTTVTTKSPKINVKEEELNIMPESNVQDTIAYINEYTMLEVNASQLEYRIGELSFNIKTLMVVNVNTGECNQVCVEELAAIINQYTKETYGFCHEPDNIQLKNYY